ncbi:DUF4145 domain-containing protein [Delftia tsuruhatensis]|uniref:DUF4145 domain-containing protein n=1 Tax=Delftia tsuruhatensis TaxID=180282 RepID=UPI00202799D3|nr:DUF4145 domain-containing protein [Delftia tsuruhatensis]
MNTIHVPPEMAIENKVLQLSRAESERGFVVLTMGYLETRLRVLIQKRRDLDGCIKELRATGMLPANLIENLDHMRKARNVFAHEWDVSSLDHERVKQHIDSLRVDPKWVMPERHHSKAYVSNVLAYTASEINREIVTREIESV